MIQAVSLLSISPIPKPQPLPPLTSTSAFPHPEPSVLVGIFPASVVQPRPSTGEDLGEPSEAYQMAVRQAEEKSRALAKGYEMDVVQEEDESELSPGSKAGVSSPVIINGDHRPTETGTGNEKRRSMGPGPAGQGRARPKSLLALAGAEMELDEEKEQPPLPTLTAGDSTLAGQQWPLIDEIACAIREWYGVSEYPFYWPKAVIVSSQADLIAHPHLSCQSGIPIVQSGCTTHRRTLSWSTTTSFSNFECR